MIHRLIQRIKSILRTRLKRFVESIIEEKFDNLFEIQLQLRDYANASDNEKASYWENKFDVNDFIQRFETLGMPIEKIIIDIEDFKAWMERHPTLTEFYSKSGSVKIEKCLEHYLTWKHLNIRKSDVIIDVASAGSPFARLLRRQGIEAYSQDLSFPAGINKYKIGGDAGDMSLPEGFADVLTLHCAFECFQGDADQRFARNSTRILKKGGRVGIVPLYIDTVHFVKTSPWCDKRNIKIEPNSLWLWRDDPYKAPFSRHYSPESFYNSIVTLMPDFNTKIIVFENLHQLTAHYPDQRIYCNFMFRGERV